MTTGPPLSSLDFNFIQTEKMYQNKNNTDSLQNTENFGKRIYVKKKSLVYLWSFLLFYLTLGGVIISQLEQKREVC